ncbi:MAG: 2-oxoacid:ferredoxin oxidoreductase subunit beta, partial [Saprospiraceae bacterium]
SIQVHKLSQDWDPTSKISAYNKMHEAKTVKEILTGLIYIDTDSKDLHSVLKTSKKPLNALTESDLCPGNDALAKICAGMR